jgi:hypothetical protein
MPKIFENFKGHIQQIIPEYQKTIIIISFEKDPDIQTTVHGWAIVNFTIDETLHEKIVPLAIVNGILFPVIKNKYKLI